MDGAAGFLGKPAGCLYDDEQSPEAPNRANQPPFSSKCIIRIRDIMEYLD